MVKHFYALLTALGFGVSCWLFTGILQVEEENAVRHQFFIKKSPTIQVIFRNPYKSTPRDEEHVYALRRDVNGNWLPESKEFEEYQRYCRYRYGVLKFQQKPAQKTCGKDAS